MQQIVGSLSILITRHEAKLRAAPGPDASPAVVQVFGQGQATRRSLVLPLVLVPTNDPRRVVLKTPPAAAVAAPLVTTGGLSIVTRNDQPICMGQYASLDLGLGYPSESGAGVAPNIHVDDGKFLVCTIFDNKYYLDNKLGRITKGTGVALVDSGTWEAYDISEWTCNNDGTLSPAFNANLCVGVSVLET